MMMSLLALPSVWSDWSADCSWGTTCSEEVRAEVNKDNDLVSIGNAVVIAEELQGYGGKMPDLVAHVDDRGTPAIESAGASVPVAVVDGTGSQDCLVAEEEGSNQWREWVDGGQNPDEVKFTQKFLVPEWRSYQTIVLTFSSARVKLDAVFGASLEAYGGSEEEMH